MSYEGAECRKNVPGKTENFATKKIKKYPGSDLKAKQ
jgi:hypothetical protein